LVRRDEGDTYPAENRNAFCEKQSGYHQLVTEIHIHKIITLKFKTEEIVSAKLSHTVQWLVLYRRLGHSEKYRLIPFDLSPQEIKIQPCSTVQCSYSNK
jgi:hypothetical protein